MAVIHQYALGHPPVDGIIGQGSEARVYTNFRSADIRWMKRFDMNNAAFMAKLDAIGKQANTEEFGLDIQDFGALQHSTYLASKGGKFDWHMDCAFVQNKDNREPFDRKLTAVIMVSHKDEFKGGELWFDEGYGRKYHLKDFCDPGDTVIFPANLWHMVTPITEGARSTITTWWMGPRWR